MSESEALDQIINDQIGQYMGDPDQFPPEFTDWLPQFLSANAPSLSNADLQGGTITPADGAPHHIDWGTGSLSFAASAAAQDTQSHRLSATPQVVFAIANTPACIVSVIADDGTSVTIEGVLPAPATVTISYFWLAIS